MFEQSFNLISSTIESTGKALREVLNPANDIRPVEAGKLLGQLLTIPETTTSLISPANPVFKSYAVYSGILGAKMLFTSIVTQDDEEESPSNDTIIQKIRRIHMNDVENVPTFWTLSFLYVLTDPPKNEAEIAFRLFLASRILYTFTYLSKGEERNRQWPFLTSIIINGFLAFKVLRYFVLQ